MNAVRSELRLQLRAAMHEQGISQSELARTTGTQQRQVSDFLAGKLDPRVSTLEAWAAALGMTITLTR